MAKRIGITPEVTGEDAIRILREMNNPPREEYKEMAKQIKEQRFVPF